MEYIHHPATEEIMHPPKISPVCGPKTFSKAIVDPAKHVELHTSSPEESEEDESIEDFVRSVLCDYIHSTDSRNNLSSYKWLETEMSDQVHRPVEEDVLEKEGRLRRARAMEKLLEVLGIPAEGRHMENHEAPVFMRRLYKKVTHPPGGMYRKPFDADLVRSYFEKGNSQSDFLIFDVSGLPSSERVVEAEIHLHRMSFLRHSDAPYHLVRVYQALSNDTSLPIDSHRLLSVQHVSSVPSAGWHILNVREAVGDWTKGRRPNLGLIVTVSSPTAWGERRLTNAEVRISRRPNSRQPILVLFNTEGVAKAKLRHPYTGYPFYYGKTEDGEQEVEQRSSFNDSAAVPSEGCERKSLLVDFRLIGWSSWIIAPKAFDLGVCHGQCEFPLDRRQNPTNHAAIQSIVHELMHGARRPCCVPSSLLPLHILFFDHSGNVILKMTKGVVAEKCACR